MARLLGAMLAAVLALAAGAAAAAELLMFDSPTCPWCLKWHREIGPVYAQTDEGRLLPLRRVDLARARPQDLAGLEPVKATPTFVVLSCGREIGRIVGYGGEDAFYGELDAIIARMKTKAPAC
jgi:thioredoxin-related protein